MSIGFATIDLYLSGEASRTGLRIRLRTRAGREAATNRPIQAPTDERYPETEEAARRHGIRRFLLELLHFRETSAAPWVLKKDGILL